MFLKLRFTKLLFLFNYFLKLIQIQILYSGKRISDLTMMFINFFPVKISYIINDIDKKSALGDTINIAFFQ